MGLHADPVARRIRPATDLRAHGRPRPQQPGLQRLACGWRRQGWNHRGIDRSVRVSRRGEPQVGLRLACDHPAPARSRFRKAHLPIQRPRHAADRRARASDPGDSRIEAAQTTRGTVLRVKWIAALSLLVTAGFFYEYLPPFKRVHLFSDIEVYHYPLQRYAFQALKEGRLPQWDSSMYCGIPFAANLQAAPFY